ncbi:borealin [Saccharomyces paradoxus]|uniref:Borealin n=1 Tax=Saccharomyces paradoxus TaxID=27291 RepID=A0A8B8UT10_SACPA|nr:Aim46 [Saccharomyces paradoxus]QHS73836.1 Aim46 [Saccharomyces paradoxus]
MVPVLTPEERQKLRSTVLHRMQLQLEKTEKQIETIKKQTLAKLNLLQQPGPASASQQKELIRQVLEQEELRIE